MKNKQLFIMALLVVFGGMNASGPSHYMPGINGITNQSSYTDRSLLWMVCSQDFTSECRLINDELLHALSYREKKLRLAATEADAGNGELAYNILKTSYRDALPEERLLKFEQALEEVLSQAPANVPAKDIEFGKKRDIAKINALFGKE